LTFFRICFVPPMRTFATRGQRAVANVVNCSSKMRLTKI
jgi:hypothetical protein